MDRNKTMLAILKAIQDILAERPQEQFVGDDDVAEKLGLDRQTAEAYLDIMAEHDYVEVTKTMGPWLVGLKARGTLALVDPAFLAQDPKSAALHLVGSNINIGILNTGQIARVESISVNINALSEAGHGEVAEALKSLTESVAQCQDLSAEARTELLEHLDYLSNQAAIEPDKRAKGVLKTVLLSIATAIGAVGSLAEIWSTWGPAICRFFGIPIPLVS